MLYNVSNLPDRSLWTTGYQIFREADWKIESHEDAFHPTCMLSLVRSVSQHNPSLNNPAGWQLLGELDLAAGSRSEEKMHAWLVETLHPLHLHEDFLDRILKSSQAMETGGRRGEAGPVHLLVYAQSNLSEGQTWGFFRIEKAGKAGLSHHSIELYLYQEDSLD